MAVLQQYPPSLCHRDAHQAPGMHILTLTHGDRPNHWKQMKYEARSQHVLIKTSHLAYAVGMKLLRWHATRWGSTPLFYTIVNQAAILTIVENQHTQAPTRAEVCKLLLHLKTQVDNTHNPKWVMWSTHTWKYALVHLKTQADNPHTPNE